MAYTPPVTLTGPTPIVTVTDSGYGLSEILSGTYAAPATSSAPNAPAYLVGVGTVTSIAISGGTTGLTASGAIVSAGTITLGGALGVSAGGTGNTSTPANGQLPIGNGTGFALATITAGAGVTIVNAAGSIIISSTISGGTVTSVGLSGGTTGLAFAGTNPIFTAGTLTLTGALIPANGGLGSTTIPANGQIPIGNGTGYVASNITAGTNITITNVAGGISIAAASATSGPVVNAYLVSGTASIAQNTFVQVPLDSVIFDSASGFNTTTHSYTPGVAGYYLICAYVTLRDPAGIQQIALNLRLNGVTNITNTYNGNAGGTSVTSQTFSYIIKLLATDYLDLIVYGTSTGSLRIGNFTGNAYPTYLNATFLRA